MKLMTTPEATPDLADKVAFLRGPTAYAERPARVEAIETHMSWVFLTPRHAYKLKKPVCYEYLDFSTPAARKRNCEEELRLNKRLAPGVYLGVVPLAQDSDGTLRLGGPGTAVDWLVMMRRLPAARMLDQLIRGNELEPEDLRAVAEMLAHFYRECEPLKIGGVEYRLQYARKMETNHEALSDPVHGLSRTLVEAAHASQRQFLQRTPELLEHRAGEGRIVEGHGDLRPEHVCLESPPVIFDRLEFNRSFRLIDPADELAFLAMECERLGASWVEAELFGGYRRVTGDHPPPQLLRFYKAQRTCLRARLAIWHLRDLPPSDWPRWRAVAEEYLHLAEGYGGKF